MGSISYTCGHCYSKTGCQINGSKQIPGEETTINNEGKKRQRHEFGGECAVCYKTSVFLCWSNYHPHSDSYGNITDHPKFFITDQHPRPVDPEVPDHLPENVSLVFMQAKDNLKRKNWDAAGMCCRRTLDFALKGTGGKIYPRIESLVKKGLLTKELGEWAHQINGQGNLANHDTQPFSESGATTICMFTELVLMYLHTLPGMLKAANPEPAKPK